MHNRMTKMQVERKTLNTNPVATNSQFIASEVRHFFVIFVFDLFSFT